MKFSKGDRVKHPGKPEWDTGQVLEDCAGADVRVYFAGAGEKKLRLDYVALTLVEGEAAAHPVLDSLGKRAPRAAASAKRGKKPPQTRPVAQLAADFLRLFPEGFYDQKYLRDERGGVERKAGPKVDKVGAHDLMTASLNREQLESLVAAGEHAEVGRRALRVIAETDLVFPREAISLKNALQTEENQRLFAENLRELLYGEAEQGVRFAAYCDRLASLGASKWPLATYFPFVAFPEREMFLKPTVTRKIAEMLGFELNYRVEPNWLTYSKLLELARYLFDSLAELRPRDMIDIQSFIWCVARYAEGEYTQPPPADAETTNEPATAAAKTATAPAAAAQPQPAPVAAESAESESGAGAAESDAAGQSNAAADDEQGASAEVSASSEAGESRDDASGDAGLASVAAASNDADASSADAVSAAEAPGASAGADGIAADASGESSSASAESSSSSGESSASVAARDESEGAAGAD